MQLLQIFPFTYFIIFTGSYSKHRLVSINIPLSLAHTHILLMHKKVADSYSHQWGSSKPRNPTSVSCSKS